MKVLVACEESQTVCKAFREKGHEAYSCDILDCSGGHPEWHIKDDVLNHLNKGWDLMIAHPPCTYLSVSGMHWTSRGLRDPQLTEDALAFVRSLLDAPINRIALENPISVISSRIRKPDQIIQPWQFGEDASKKTCFWLKNLPALTYSKIIPPHDWCNVVFADECNPCIDCGEPYCEIHDSHYSECSCLGPTEDDAIYKIVDGVLFGTKITPPPKMVWGNQTPSGQNKLGPSKDRAKIRSKTYEGIAVQMAEQWG